MPRINIAIDGTAFSHEEWFKKHAKKKCPTCKGKGIIRWTHDCDTTQYTPCVECFPSNKSAKSEAEFFYSRIDGV